MKIFNADNYVNQLKNLPTWDLILRAAHWDLNNGNITGEQVLETINAVDRHFFPAQQRNLSEYVSTVMERATPEAAKAAKKSIVGYAEALIWHDRQNSRISPAEAKAAKEMLPNFLNQNKTDANEA